MGIFFLCVSPLGAFNEGFIALQERVIDVFEENKNAVVRVYGAKSGKEKVKEGEEGTELQIGTGFFISKEGHVMTTANVVAEASRVWVQYRDTFHFANVIGFDANTNISILQLHRIPQALSFIRIDESLELPKPGTFLLGVTCKLGLDPGPSMGMVSGWDREYLEVVLPTTLIRSSILSDGGEGGSPIFDLKGRFVGMMMFQLNDIHSSFIVPARAALRIRDDLVFSGKVSYGYLGIEIDQEATLASGRYMIVGRALPDSPADHAGLKRGDKLLEFNDVKINRISDLNHATFFARPGQYLSLKIRRNGKELKVPVKITEKPEEKTKKAADECCATE